MRAHFRADVGTPAEARRFVTDHLDSVSGGSDPRRDDVALVVSELVTNSVRAGAFSIEVWIASDSQRIEICVADDAPGWPTPRSAHPDDLGGRGLAIVERLADAWTTAPAYPGKAVTATWFDPRSPT